MLWTKVTLTLEGLQEKVHCIVVLSKFLIAGKLLGNTRTNNTSACHNSGDAGELGSGARGTDIFLCVQVNL